MNAATQLFRVALDDFRRSAYLADLETIAGASIGGCRYHPSDDDLACLGTLRLEGKACPGERFAIRRRRMLRTPGGYTFCDEMVVCGA